MQMRYLAETNQKIKHAPYKDQSTLSPYAPTGGHGRKNQWAGKRKTRSPRKSTAWGYKNPTIRGGGVSPTHRAAHAF